MGAGKKVAIGLGVSAAIVGGMLAFLWPSIQKMNQPQIAVVGPGQELTLTVDGGEPITVGAKGMKIVDVDAGAHTVVFSAPLAGEHSVTVQSGERWIVPGLDPQCYGQLDVSKSHYDTGTKGKVAPSLKEVRSESAPFKLSKSHYLHPNHLPSSVEAGRDVWLFRSASCESLENMQAAKSAK